MDISNIKKNLSAAKFLVHDQAFRFECNSLRPYTRYYVIFDQLDYSGFCQQDGKNIGEALISDSGGKLKFTMFWNRQNENAVLNNTQFAKLFDSPIGNKVIVIQDKSGKSFVQKTIYFTNNNPNIMFSKYNDSSSILPT